LLFVLSDKLYEFCKADNGPELEGLQNLLLSARKGQHALTGSHKIFSTLAKNSNLSQRERATALGLANRRAELPILESHVRRKVYVSPDAGGKARARVDEYTWSVSIGELNTKFLNSLVVLAENMIDAELYQYAGRHYQIWNKLNGVVISSSARGGGGSQIDVELKKLLSEGFPVLSITDGDIAFPGAPASVISNRCEAVVQSEEGVGWHFPLPAREIENIIPRGVLLLVADPKNGGDAHDSLEGICRSEGKIGSCAADFLCLKKGQTLGQALAHENSSEREYLILVAGAIKSERPNYFSVCVDDGVCASEPCRCSISLGFGEAILVQVKKWISERSHHESLKSFASSEVWMRVGSMVFDAGIAFKPEKI
jgi:hypothetical protein